MKKIIITSLFILDIFSQDCFGQLKVDGGTLQNADITLIPRCTVILRNNGVINMAPGKVFNAPEGANVIIESGEIN